MIGARPPHDEGRTRTLLMRYWARGLLPALAILAFVVPATAQAEAPGCVKHQVPVQLSPDDSTQYQVTGWLCGSDHAVADPHSTVMLLLPGILETHSYYDLSYDFPRYSFVAAATKRDFVVFNLDRIGDGESS